MADSPECKKDKRADSLGSLDPEDWVVNPEPLEGQVPREEVAQVWEVLSQMKRTDRLGLSSSGGLAYLRDPILGSLSPEVLQKILPVGEDFSTRSGSVKDKDVLSLGQRIASSHHLGRQFMFSLTKRSNSASAIYVTA
jgi:hypothetical protein